jgi:hypothetical protein
VEDFEIGSLVDDRVYVERLQIYMLEEEGRKLTNEEIVELLSIRHKLIDEKIVEICKETRREMWNERRVELE